MTQSELKEKIEKLDKAIKSPTTPASFLPNLKSKKEGFENDLKNLSKSEAPKPAAEKPAAPKPAAEKPAAPKPAASKPAAEKPAASKSAKSISKTAAEKCRELLNQDKARKKSEEKRVTSRKKQGKPAKLTPSEVVNKTAKVVQSKVVTMDMSKREIEKLSAGFVIAIKNAIKGIMNDNQKHLFIKSIITDLSNIDRKFKKTAEYGGYMADGGETVVEDEQMVTRGFYEDEPYEYARGGVNYLKKWKVVFITMQGRKGIKEITLGRMSDKQDVHNALKRMPDTNIREVISIEELKEDGGMMARGGVASKFEVGDKVMVDDSGYVQSFHGVDLSKPATITSKNKVKFGGKTYFTYNIETEDGRKPYNTAVESKLMPVGMAHGGMMAKGGHTKDYSGNYYSTYDFVGTNNLEKEANSVFGKNWEAEDDANQILELSNSLGGGYKVKVADDRDDWQNLRYKHDVNHTTNDSNYDIFVFHSGRKRKMEDGGMIEDKYFMYGTSEEGWFAKDRETGRMIHPTEFGRNSWETKEELVSDLKSKHMAHGGMSQGYDDREDERLAMKYGRIGSKYLNSTKARRDDARFEERGKMEDGGMMAKGGRAKAEQNVLNKRIGEYYLDTFKTDDLGFKINSKATFGGLLRVLDNGGNIYEYIGVGDSIIRERVFGKLAKLMNVDYDVIYDKWLFGNEMADGGFVVGEAQDVSRYSNYKGKGYPVMKKSVGNNSDFVLFVYKTKEEAEAKAKQLNERGKMEDGGIMAKGGRPLSAINRDRAYESQDELWEQNYKRQTRPKHPKYSK
jgi:hypothetical protein